MENSNPCVAEIEEMESTDVPLCVSPSQVDPVTENLPGKHFYFKN